MQRGFKHDRRTLRLKYKHCIRYKKIIKPSPGLYAACAQPDMSVLTFSALARVPSECIVTAFIVDLLSLSNEAWEKEMRSHVQD